MSIHSHACVPTGWRGLCVRCVDCKRKYTDKKKEKERKKKKKKPTKQTKRQKSSFYSILCFFFRVTDEFGHKEDTFPSQCRIRTQIFCNSYKLLRALVDCGIH